MKKSVLILLLILFSCGKEKTIKKYSFFVAGHTYGEPRVDNIGFHPPFKNKFNFINSNKLIEFGVLTGDIVITSTNKNWDEIDNDLELLKSPVHFAVGNHDIDNPEIYRSRYGQTFKSFIHNSDLFIILDPNIDNWNISGEQLLFLENTINKNHLNVDNIFVFFHQMLWWESNNIFKNIKMNSITGRSNKINFWTQVEPLFNSLKNKTYMFCGDMGAWNNGNEFMYYSYDNITFVGSGMGAGIKDNFIIVDINDTTVNFRLIALNGDNVNSLGYLTDYILP